MRDAFAAARGILCGAAGALGYGAGDIPLRLDAPAGALISALARKLAGGGDAASLALALAGASEVRQPFSCVRSAGSMLVLELSGDWMRSVLRRSGEIPWPALPVPGGVRACDREDRAFLLDYTARRCFVLSRRGETCPDLPRGLVCLLAREGADPVAAARLFWALSPQQRRDRDMARAVGLLAAGAVFTKNSPQGPKEAL